MMKKFLTTTLLLTIISSLIATPTITKAGNLQNSYIESTSNIKRNIEENESLDSKIDVIAYTENSLEIKDKTNNEITRIIYNKNRTEAKIYNSNGQVDILIKDENNNIYLNNELILETIIEKNQLNTRNSWQYITTFRTKASYYKSTASSITSAIIGMIPGFSGAATIAGVAMGIVSSVQPEVFIEIKQYFNKSTRFVKNETRYLRNSNYTGLIKTSTHEYRIY